MMDRTPQRYVSAIERLRQLPAVFRGSDLTVQFQWTSQTASVYLSQWRKTGLVQSLGGHSDVHMNLIVQPRPDLERALWMAYPRAVVVGAEMLREAGWTTQIPSAPEVAVPQGGPLHALEQFTLSPRPEKWFALVAPAVVRVAAGPGRLPAAWALADMLARALDRRIRSSWLLAPDDLDLESARSDPQMPAALVAFDLPGNCLDEVVYGGIYEELQERRVRRPANLRPRGRRRRASH